MDEREEAAYVQGQRAVWRAQLVDALKNLGYDSPETQKLAWILEREATVEQLHQVCAEHGDNEWDASLHLADVVQNHLARHLD